MVNQINGPGSRGGSGTIRWWGKVRVRMDLWSPVKEPVEEVAAEEAAELWCSKLKLLLLQMLNT